MNAEGLLLVLTVGVIGVLHTIVPDHWVPITLMARQRGWSKMETAKAALTAGTVALLLNIGPAVLANFGPPPSFNLRLPRHDRGALHGLESQSGIV